MGQHHVRVLSSLSNLIAIVDLDKERGKALSSKYKVPFYSDYNKILDKLDAAVIAVPTDKHRVVAETLLDAGVHILVEKPLASNLIDAESIINKARINKRNLAVGHIERHNPIVKKIKKMHDAGELGNIISITTRRVSPTPDRIRDVGVVMDLAIHDLDIVKYIIGEEVERVQSSFSAKDGGLEKHANILLEFSGNCSAFCEVSWSTPIRIREIIVTCEKAYLKGDYAKQSLKSYTGNYNVTDSNAHILEENVEIKEVSIEKMEPLYLELDDFLSSIVNNHSPLVTGVEGLEAVRLANQALNKL